jgi:hypothetical protein
MKKLIILVVILCAPLVAQYDDFMTRFDFRLIELPDGIPVTPDFIINDVQNTINLRFMIATDASGYYITPHIGSQIDFYINNTSGLWSGDTAYCALSQPVTEGVWELCGNIRTIDGQLGWSQPKYILVERRQGYIMILFGE